MTTKEAQQLVQKTLQNPFDKGQFVYFIKNLVNEIDESKAFHARGYVHEKYRDKVKTYERIGSYTDPEDNKIDILIVYLQKESSIDRARTTLRNFVGDYLKERGEKEAGLIAFVSPNQNDWRFSLVKMEYKITETPSGRVKAKEEFTPAKRYSFLVGVEETSHTAQSRLVPILEDDATNPTLKQIEEAFNIEKVTKEFFEKYRDLYLRVKETLDEVLKNDKAIKADFAGKNIDTVDFGKKLLGQIVFLYFLQKKGWFGVKRGEAWGSGSKNFLRELFDKKHGDYKNFFNDILEPLFYEALRNDRSHDDHYFSMFKCKIPFLNGGLFDPINNYDWKETDIILRNDLFSNDYLTKEKDKGTGILDIFDRYNFTVKEDEPLEKEVAVDPEMLGKVFENLLEVKDRKSKGTYYTPREIVHYMCQESLVNYLATELEKKVSKKDIETLIKFGESTVEHEAEVKSRGKETKTYSYKLPKSVRDNANLIDEKLETIRICDPAVGSGAFPVGMMNEIIRTRNALTSYLKTKKGRTIYDFKRHAIQNCLYGVDIDLGAVEIAKLRLWLSLIVDEEDIKQIKPLPNLDYKIMQGNSLLGVQKEMGGMKDMFYEHSMSELEKTIRLHLNEANANKKQEYKAKIDELIGKITHGHREFDFEVYFSEVFREKGGFDVVIANPPYVSVKEISTTDKTIFAEIFETGHGRFNLFTLFLEKGNKILRLQGILTFILPEGLYSNVEYQYIRKYLLDNTSILFIGLFTERVFEAAVDTSIISTMKGGKSLEKFPVIRDLGYRVSTLNQDSFRELPFYLFAVNLDNKSKDIIYKVLDGDKTKIDKILEIQQGIIYSGLSKGEVFSNEKKSQTFKKVLDGRDVLKWLINWKEKRENKYINYSSKLHRAREERLFLAKEKLLLPRKSTKISCAYDNEQYYCLNTAYTCLIKKDEYSIKFILSILNSVLINYFYSKLFFGWQVTIPALNSIGVPQIKLKDQQPFIILVDKILAVTKDDDYLENSEKQAKVRDYEKQIDQLVYKLYGLTPEEIKIVENNAQ